MVASEVLENMQELWRLWGTCFRCFRDVRGAYATASPERARGKSWETAFGVRQRSCSLMAQPGQIYLSHIPPPLAFSLECHEILSSALLASLQRARAQLSIASQMLLPKSVGAKGSPQTADFDQNVRHAETNVNVK
jgi:hypothetical protein